MRFDPEYVRHVLNDNFEDAKTLFLSPLLAVHHAHLVMLAACGIVDGRTAHRLRLALDSISVADVRCARYDGSCEDLFFYVERLLVTACGEDAAGRLRAARSRNDIDMTMYRMQQRESILAVLAATLELREALIELAANHRETLFAAHTHTQPAQPTTVAHYLLAMIEQLERDSVRLRAGYASTNRSPLGACAITGTGFEIDRDLTSDLLGFDGPTGNTYGSIATVDYLLEGVSATAVLLSGLGRFVQDLLVWCTVEFGYLRLADGFVQTSSIMPQKRNPVALEHARGIGSKALGQASAIVMAVHNTPFGDVVDIEDDLQPLVAAMFRDARRAVSLVAAALRGCEVDVERLESRAAEGGTTLTELADHLVRENGIPFAAAHAIAARLLPDPLPAGEPLDSVLRRVSADVLGAPLQYSAAELTRILSARHFVEVRRTAGGPAPEVTKRALDESRRALDADRAWLDASRARLDAAQSRLAQRSQAL
ncbi:MAG TPA: argininosuccinate lyase [Vicinamibacterales bacterium]|nr:argininosuccinate lyase [Vicinamibacterales bacterium]